MVRAIGSPEQVETVYSALAPFPGRLERLVAARRCTLRVDKDTAAWMPIGVPSAPIQATPRHSEQRRTSSKCYVWIDAARSVRPGACAALA